MPEETSTKFKLPKEWSKEFTVTVSRGGGMLDERLAITLTYDSCKFMHRLQGEKTENTFLMTNDLREEVLKKLHELKVDKIQVDFSVGLIYDKATSSIVFRNQDESFLIQNSAQSEIKRPHRENFNQAFGYLQLFAMQKRK